MKEAPEWEKEIGIEVYSSRCSPCRALARVHEGDFVVEETPSLEGLAEAPVPGYFPLYKVEKWSIDTMHLERELSHALGCRVSLGGLKDKRAVAVQYATLIGRTPRRMEKVTGKNFRADLVGYVPAPITRASVLSNRFRITLRECCPSIETNAKEVFGLASEGLVPNYFGHQRFGGSGARTCGVGIALVKRDFEGAVRLMLCEPRRNDDEATVAARELMSSERYAEGLALLPQSQDTERLVARSMARDPTDHIRALRAVPLKLRRLFVQAYQSLIFNRSLSLAMREGIDISSYAVGDNWCLVDGATMRFGLPHGVKEPAPDHAKPLVQIPGYAYRNYGSRFDPLTEEAMAVDGVRARDFFVSEMQEVSAEGGFRMPHVTLRDPSVEQRGEVSVLGLSLARGQYATIVLREVVKPSNPADIGVA